MWGGFKEESSLVDREGEREEEKVEEGGRVARRPFLERPFLARVEPKKMLRQGLFFLSANYREKEQERETDFPWFFSLERMRVEGETKEEEQGTFRACSSLSCFFFRRPRVLVLCTGNNRPMSMLCFVFADAHAYAILRGRSIQFFPQEKTGKEKEK